MTRFYANREEGKRTKAEALRQAQLDLLKGRNGAATASQRTDGVQRRAASMDEDIVVDPKYRIPFKVDKKSRLRILIIGHRSCYSAIGNRW